MQLICFPFAGGYSASFRPLHEHLKTDFDMLAIEPPGHGTNRMALVDNLEKLADLYIAYAKPLPAWLSLWKEGTESSYDEYQGAGRHDEMLADGFVKSNADLIRQILGERAAVIGGA
ncbi:hypothetical protein DT075_33400 [Bacillus licheniformis]|nr:hypothetical protein DT075_33400 [Bacillus licheniformis]